jgi:hypothetical protein
MTTGCVTYTRRFCEETFKDPATASPLIFPETVFNASASHLAAYLNSTGPASTLVGDDGTFINGLGQAAGWVEDGAVDGCVVVGAQEADWIVAHALKLFEANVVHSEGAGALYLTGKCDERVKAELSLVTEPCSFTAGQGRATAARAMRSQFPAPGQRELLCMSMRGKSRHDGAEQAAWGDWPEGLRLAPRERLGEAFTAASAWQCVFACDSIVRGKFGAVNVSVVGADEQACGARFLACAR